MEAHSLIEGNDKLFSLPEVCQQLARLLGDEKCADIEIAELISYDPVLTARILNRANHPSYPGPPLDTVSDAIDRIGMDNLKQLFSSTASVSAFEQIDPKVVDMESFWHHSVCCAMAAESLAITCGLKRPGQLFVAGLIHDIGQLVIYQSLPDLALKVLETAGEEESFRYKAEKKILGLTHAQVGKTLVEKWRLPAMIQETVEFHHEPQLAGEFLVEASIVHIATAIANCVEPSWKMNLERHDANKQIDPQAWEISGLSSQVIGPTLSDINMQALTVLGIVDPDSIGIY